MNSHCGFREGNARIEVTYSGGDTYSIRVLADENEKELHDMTFGQVLTYGISDANVNTLLMWRCRIKPSPSVDEKYIKGLPIFYTVEVDGVNRGNNLTMEEARAIHDSTEESQSIRFLPY